MPRLQSIAHAIKARIEEIPQLFGKVVVYRSSSIEAEFESRMGKVKGKMVIVRLITGTNESKNKGTARFSGTYTVSLFTASVLNQKDAKDADQLMDDIIEKLHAWWPQDIASNGNQWAEATTLTYPDDPQFDVAVLTLECPRKSA